MKILREFVSELLLAETRAANEAEELGLALHEWEEGGGWSMALYDPSALEKGGDAASSILKKNPDLLVRGFIDLVPCEGGNCNGAAQVGLVVGSGGWGTFMYYLAMSKFGALVSDREGMTTPSARKVWQEISKDPRVVATPLDDSRSHNPDGTAKEPHINHTDTVDDDCKVVDDQLLNSSFSLKNSINMSGLRRNHMLADEVHGPWLSAAVKSAAANLFKLRYKK